MNVWEPIISNQPSARVEIGLINSYYGYSMRRGPYKVLHTSKKFIDMEKDKTNRWQIPNDPKCAKAPREDGVRLYNIDEDPSETCDLGTTLKDIADGMVAAIEKYKADHKATMSNGFDSFIINDGDCDDYKESHYPLPIPSDWICDPKRCKSPPWIAKCNR